ncbi:hypothetical protein [Mycobacterium sp. SMC-4]|uniref:hypothetical protein n=1 Tax=Mycobacterium sp. SMC-4 TaxID=2857059 RepID=UPI0021B2F3B6|nr:hypothetical protein [Mycobacterium sp. SMC-4]UXA17879.1 hypothetical protein KXD98_24875 [Mycobacterium sp. SMC-4]
MTTACRACEAGLEHCHGALIHHAYQRDECTEGDCLAAAAAHDVQIDCSSLGCACDEVRIGFRSARRIG